MTGSQVVNLHVRERMIIHKNVATGTHLPVTIGTHVYQMRYSTLRFRMDDNTPQYRLQSDVSFVN